MTEATKAIRLSKAAREFNVGIHTIVDFLLKKGIEIDEKPTSKLSPEAYDMLVQEFQTEKAVKAESKKMEIDTSLHTSISIDDIDREPTEDSEKEEDIIIQKTSIIDPEPEVKPAEKPAEKPVKKKTAKEAAEAKKEEEKPAEKKEEEAPEKEEAPIKVLDKIDLDAINQKTRPAKKTKEEKAKETADKKKTAASKKKEVKEEPVETPEKAEKVVEAVTDEKIEQPEELSLRLKKKNLAITLLKLSLIS